MNGSTNRSRNTKKIELVDYDTCKITFSRKVLYVLQAASLIYALGYLFYRSHLLSALISAFALLYPRIKARRLVKKHKSELSRQFKDMLYCLSSSLSTGKPIEAAFKDTLKDLLIIYPDPKTSIISEVGIIVRRIEMNETVEDAVSDFALRSHDNDINNFAGVFRICKRTGGNISEVMKNTSNIISDRIEISSELDIILAQKKFEQKILGIIPAFMVLVISLFAGDYIEPVFTTLTGKLVMTVSAFLWAAAWLISSKITDIRL
jgi:tight adherence protein B